MTGIGGAGYVSLPWHRSVVNLLLARPRVDLPELLDLVEKGKQRGTVSRVHAEADRRNALGRMLGRLAELGAVEVRSCHTSHPACSCAVITVVDKVPLERLAREQAAARAGAGRDRRPAPAPFVTVDGARPLRVVRGGAA